MQPTGVRYTNPILSRVGPLKSLFMAGMVYQIKVILSETVTVHRQWFTQLEGESEQINL